MNSSLPFSSLKYKASTKKLLRKQIASEKIVNKKDKEDQLKENIAVRNLSSKDMYSLLEFVRECIDENEVADLFSDIIDEIKVKLKELKKTTKNFVVYSECSSVHEEHTENYNKTRDDV